MSGLRRPTTSVTPKDESTVPTFRGVNCVDGRNVIPPRQVKPAPKMVDQSFSKIGSCPHQRQLSQVRAYRVSCAKSAPKSRGVFKPFRETPTLPKYRKATPTVDPDLKLLNELIAKRKNNPEVSFSARQEARATRTWLEHKKHYGVGAERVENSLSRSSSLCVSTIIFARLAADKCQTLHLVAKSSTA